MNSSVSSPEGTLLCVLCGLCGLCGPCGLCGRFDSVSSAKWQQSGQSVASFIPYWASSVPAFHPLRLYTCLKGLYWKCGFPDFTAEKQLHLSGWNSRTVSQLVAWIYLSLRNRFGFIATDAARIPPKTVICPWPSLVFIYS